MSRFVFVFLSAAVILCQPAAHAQTVIASQDFDGGASNLVSGFTAADNIDGGGGDFFGIGSIGAWPQADAMAGTANIPFGLVDDSVIGISADGTAGSAFAGDTEAIFGQARSATDAFFAISDIRDEQPVTAAWTFDVSAASNPLTLSVDMGQQSNGDSFGGITTSDLQIQYSFDGGTTFATAINLQPVTASGGFAFRELDNATVPVAAGVLEAIGATKTLVDTGAVATDSFLNKSPASGAGAGGLDTFTASLNGSGGQLVVQIAANDFPFEGIAFDNIVITETVPEPSSGAGLVLMGIAALVTIRRRR